MLLLLLLSAAVAAAIAAVECCIAGGRGGAYKQWLQVERPHRLPGHAPHDERPRNDQGSAASLCRPVQAENHRRTGVSHCRSVLARFVAAVIQFMLPDSAHHMHKSENALIVATLLSPLVRMMYTSIQRLWNVIRDAVMVYLQMIVPFSTESQLVIPNSTSITSH